MTPRVGEGAVRIPTPDPQLRYLTKHRKKKALRVPLGTLASLKYPCSRMYLPLVPRGCWPKPQRRQSLPSLAP